jgi:hypothetical protein
MKLPEDPVFSTGVSSFSNANNFVFDRLKAETKTDLKSSSRPVLKLVLY